MTTPTNPSSDPVEEIKKLLKDYYVYMKQCDLAADSRDSHTTVKNAINDANKVTDYIAAKINRLLVESRLIELDLLEQAINQGRDMNEYKLLRLAELTNQLNEEG